MPKLVGSGAGFFTIENDIAESNDYQRGSARIRVLGDNVGLAEIGDDGILSIVNPVIFSDWLDPVDVAYPDLQTLIDDLQDNIFLDLTNAGDVPEAPIDGTPYVRQDAAWVSESGIPDAPNNAFYYGRRGAAWERVSFDLRGDSTILGAPFDTTADTYQDVLTHEFTPDVAADDWLMILQFSWTITDKSKLAFFRLTVNGTPGNEVVLVGNEDNTILPIHIEAELVGVAAALQTIVLQTRNDAGESETIEIETARIATQKFRKN